MVWGEAVVLGFLRELSGPWRVEADWGGGMGQPEEVGGARGWGGCAEDVGQGLSSPLPELGQLVPELREGVPG